MSYITFDESVLTPALNYKQDKIITDVYSICEKYADKNNILRSQVYAYTYFTKNALYHSNELCNQIAKLTDFVELRTRIPYKEFHIIFEFKYTVVFYNLDDVAQRLLTDEYHDGLFIDIDIDMIFIYSILYNLEHKDDWPKYRDIKTEISKKAFDKSKKLLNTNKKFGGNEYITNLGDPETITHKTKNTLWDTLSLLDVVWINTNRFQCITDNKQQVLTLLTNKYTNITCKDLDYKIPVDYRETKTTVYINIDKSNIPILDIFNNAEYELIPYFNESIQGKKIKVAHNLVKLRYLYTEKTILKLKRILGYGNNAFNVVNDINNISKLDEPIETPLFYGQYYPNNIAVKEKYLNSTFYPYIPYMWYKQHNSYRHILENKK